jgi:superfamily II DNA or RNA helicase
MIPQITEALLTRTIQTSRMVSAGRDYWRRGFVSDLRVDHDSGIVQALVKGSTATPYRVELRFRSTSGLTTKCSCPVGFGCKHAAATMFAMQENQHSRPASGTPSQQSARPVSARHDAPLPGLEMLPPVLSQWAAAMRPLVERASGALTGPSRAILYVVRAQSAIGSTRLSKKRPLASLAPPGCAVRLLVEAFDVALDVEGRPVGNGTKVQAAGLYGVVSGPPWLADEDRLLLRRLQLRIGDTDHEGCLAGLGGADLLERVLATGRARWATVQGPSLHRASAIRAQFGWLDDDLGRTRLSVEGLFPGHAVALAAPPLSIDTLTGAVVPLDLGVPPAMAEQLLRLPPIEPAAILALAARWRDLVPANVPPPALPEIRDLGLLSPVPVLSLRMDRVEMEEPYIGRYRHTNKTRAACAVARLGFDYAGTVIDATTAEQTMLVRTETGLVRFTRDVDTELAAMARLLTTGLIPLIEFEDVDPAPRQDWDYAPEMPASPEDFTPFMLYDAEALRSEGWRVEVASDFPLRVVAAETDSLSMDVVPSGIDWFDIALGATIDGERVDLVPALRRLLAAIDVTELDRLEQDLGEPGDLVPVALGNGKVVTLEAAHVLPVLRALLLLATNNPISGSAIGRPGFSSLDLGLLGAIEAATPSLPWSGVEPLRRLARELTQLKVDPTPLPAAFMATLRPYQQTGFDWLEALARAGLGGLLADDMGLGKTVQTLAHIMAQKAVGALDKPMLIVAPTSVLPNWQSEVARFAPSLSMLLLHGPDRHDRHETIAGHDIVLTSYPLLVRDEAALSREPFGLAVFDEAHMLKNPQTVGHRAARALTADRKIALTGTPVENRLTDAWALFDVVVPGLLGNQRAFARDYRNPIEKHGEVEARARLARKLRPFLLRRTKDAVAVDLPAKSVVPLAITLGSAQMALHESQRILMQQRVRDEIARVGLMRAQIVVLTALTRLRQVCCDPRLLPGQGSKPPASAKLERLLELIDELIAEGRRIILFSQFTSMLELIKPELDSRHHDWVELTGKCKDRKTPIARFQAGGVPLILVSLKAGGTGLNLTAADTVILYDPWWNPAVEAQAIDRAHRIGQRKPVFVYRMIATGTIEEKILALQQRKAALAEALWSEDAASPAHLTEDDIAYLLG